MSFNCHFCSSCKGIGCIGEMPGMGGPNNSINFILNCRDWKSIQKESFSCNREITTNIRLAPITGAIENVGYCDEKQFYFDIIKFACQKGYNISIGDGTPDFKLQYGIQAVEAIRSLYNNKKAAVFIKPYPNNKIIERLDKASHIAEVGGIDIDSYNIVTMRNLVNLEQKTPAQLLEIKNFLSKKGIPFAIKGVFKEEDIELCKEVKPDIIYISNHGGRVDTRQGSTAIFLQQYGETLHNYCDKLWIDGGIRTKEDILTAQDYGIDTVLMGRPFITALCNKKDLSF